MLCAEQLLAALNRQTFNLIDNVATTIVTFSWKTFRILVRCVRSDGLSDGRACIIFGCDEFQSFRLSSFLVIEKNCHRRIHILELGRTTHKKK